MKLKDLLNALLTHEKTTTIEIEDINTGDIIETLKVSDSNMIYYQNIEHIEHLEVTSINIESKHKMTIYVNDVHYLET